jgi:hypothetical protein
VAWPASSKIFVWERHKLNATTRIILQIKKNREENEETVETGIREFRVFGLFCIIGTSPSAFRANQSRRSTVESQTPSESTPQKDAVKARNFFSRLGGVYFSPGETFREIGSSPKVLAPIVAMIIIGLLVGFYLARNLDLQSLMAGQMQKAVEQGRITKEQMEQQMPLVLRLASVQLVVGAAIGSLVLSLIIAAAFKLITTLIGAENRFKAVFTVTCYTMIAVSIIQSALLILVVQLKGPGELDISNVNSALASNLGALISSILSEDALPKFLLRLAGWVDIFAIWRIALLAIGYAAVSRKLKTATAATWLTGAYLVIALIGSAIGPLKIGGQ